MEDKTLSRIVEEHMCGIEKEVNVNLYLIIKTRAEMCALSFASQELLKNQEKVNKILADAFNK